MINVRREQAGDADAVREINLRAFAEAFGSRAEADLVDRLREACPEAVSLVAEMDDRLVGHILFTPVVIEASGGEAITGMGLAPMAVAPEFQRQGIGSKLVATGLEMVRKAGYPFVVVLGHPEYYPRFGFVPAGRHGITCEFADVPADAFMIRVFDQSAVADVTGVARYRHEFCG